LIDLLATGMLRIDPEERFPAAKCLEKGRELGIFDGHDLNTGSATPMQRKGRQDGISDDDDDDTTIILGTFWNAADGDSRMTKRGSPRHASAQAGSQRILESRDTQITPVEEAQVPKVLPEQDSGVLNLPLSSRHNGVAITSKHPWSLEVRLDGLRRGETEQQPAARQFLSDRNVEEQPSLVWKHSTVDPSLAVDQQIHCMVRGRISAILKSNHYRFL